MKTNHQVKPVEKKKVNGHEYQKVGNSESHLKAICIV